MNKTIKGGLLAILAGCPVCSSAQQTSADVAGTLPGVTRALTGGTMFDRRAAARTIARLPREALTGAIIRAVVQELLRLRHASDEPSIADDPRAAADDEDDYLQTLVEIASRSTDPHVINALRLYLNTGSMVDQALARFGELAAPALLAIAADTASSPAGGALNVLALMIRTPSDFPLSTSSKEWIRLMARKRITEPQSDWLMIVYGTRAAKSLRDTSLLRIAAAMSKDSTAARRLGVDHIRAFLTLMADALAHE